MTRDSKRPRRIVHWALGFISVSVLASPVLAETTTLSCEGEQSAWGNTVPWSGSIDIDYAGGRISVPAFGIMQEPAVITDRKISFQRGPDGSFDFLGWVDRLSGTMGIMFGPNRVGGATGVHARCRPATQKF